MSSSRLILVAAAFGVLSACAAHDPEPSPSFDGRYVGTRQSKRPEVCGIGSPDGTTSATVKHGHVSLPLFGPHTVVLTGAVGDDGRVRASGWGKNPTGGFPALTVLNGQIANDVLEGTASDMRCQTEVKLQKTRGREGPPRPPHR